VLEPNQERDDHRLRERELNLREIGREIERGWVIVKENKWAPYIAKWTAQINPKWSYPMAGGRFGIKNRISSDLVHGSVLVKNWSITFLNCRKIDQSHWTVSQSIAFEDKFTQ